jgi:hypothetical protein
MRFNAPAGQKGPRVVGDGMKKEEVRCLVRWREDNEVHTVPKKRKLQSKADTQDNKTDRLISCPTKKMMMEGMGKGRRRIVIKCVRMSVLAL